MLNTSNEKTNVLFVTSFNKELYEASGKNLIKSYKKTNQIQYSSLICGIDYDVGYQTEESIIWWPLRHNSILTNFLNTYKDKIPEYLGGTAKPCNCKEPWAKNEKHHIKGCHFTWWNRNCFRWLNKLALIDDVVTYYDSKYIIWIDSDCIFKKQMSEHFLDHIFKGSDLVYFKGPARLVDETGVFGIRLNERGRSFIMKLKQLYMSGYIFKLKRWDDSYAIMKLRTNMNI